MLSANPADTYNENEQAARVLTKTAEESHRNSLLSSVYQFSSCRSHSYVTAARSYTRTPTLESQNTPLVHVEAAHLPPPPHSSSYSGPPSYVEEEMAETLPSYKDVALPQVQQRRLSLPNPP